MQKFKTHIWVSDTFEKFRTVEMKCYILSQFINVYLKLLRSFVLSPDLPTAAADEHVHNPEKTIYHLISCMMMMRMMMMLMTMSTTL